MNLRQEAQENHNARLADTYLLIAASCEFDTLKPNYLQLCNLMFLNMLMIEAKQCYKREKNKDERRLQRKQYFALKQKERKMRDIIKQKL